MQPMRHFRLNKLVRDKIVERMHSQGAEPEVTILSTDATLEELRKKIIEEAGELAFDKPEELLAELADLQEVLDEILVLSGNSKTELDAAQHQKREKLGGFKNKQFIGVVHVPNESEWSEYYAQDPVRFPEEK